MGFLPVDVQGKGYDASKKILGIRRHIAVGTQRLTPTNITDQAGALFAFEKNKELEKFKGTLREGGYSG